jgi:hypothetical protein
MPSEYLHRDEVPEALAVLDTLLGERDPLRAGYTPDISGAAVDWHLLADSDLTNSEKGVVHIAHGLAILERHGGSLPVTLRSQILAAVQAVIEVP